MLEAPLQPRHCCICSSEGGQGTPRCSPSSFQAMPTPSAPAGEQVSVFPGRRGWSLGKGLGRARDRAGSANKDTEGTSSCCPDRAAPGEGLSLESGSWVFCEPARVTGYPEFVNKKHPVNRDTQPTSSPSNVSEKTGTQKWIVILVPVTCRINIQ